MSGLREVLAAHHRDWGDCCCSEYVLEVPYDEHLETAVLDWLRARLASDEVREAAAEAVEMCDEHAASRGAPDVTCGTCVRVRRDAERQADAALTAVLAALEAER